MGGKARFERSLDGDYGRGGYITMILLFIMYAVLGVGCIYLLKRPSASDILYKIGLCKAENAKAYAVINAGMWLVLTPTLLYYFAILSPFYTAQWLRIVFAVAATLLLAGAVGGYFVITDKVYINGMPLKAYYEGGDRWLLPLSVVFGAIGMALVYLTIFLVRDVGDGLFDKFLHVSGSGWKYAVVYVFAMLANIVLFLIRSMGFLSAKCPGVFVMIATVLLIVFVPVTAFVFGIFCIVSLPIALLACLVLN
ncbi:MAG: hypothetical protein K2L51_04130 [Clostridiales bacterium]|nr:hypothetical protein [Clostridiales bacterium]